MSATEYFVFIPLLIYGMAMAELFGEWKRLIDPEQWYLPYLLMTIMLSELAVYNVYIYAKLLDNLVGISYFNYLKYLVPPFLFLMTVHAFTPDAQEKTEDYFVKRMPIFFTLLAAFVASHFFFEFEGALGRSIGVAGLIVAGWSRKPVIIYPTTVLWIILIFLREDTFVTL